MMKNPVVLTGKYTVKPGDRLFDSVNDYLIIMSAVAHASSLMAGGRTHKIKKPVGRLDSAVVGHAFALPLRGPLENALMNITPPLIEIGTTSLSETRPLEDIVLQTAGLNKVFNHVIAPIFLAYFERYNVWLTEHLGDAVNWPMTLNFARVVRNAISHGSITIRNPNAIPVTWHGLSYGYNDNGKQIVGTDLRFGDIFGLMFEVDDALDGLSVPVL